MSHFFYNLQAHHALRLRNLILRREHLIYMLEISTEESAKEHLLQELHEIRHKIRQLRQNYALNSEEGALQLMKSPTPSQ